MGKVGIPELLIILTILVLIFGANRLPELGRALGRAHDGAEVDPARGIDPVGNEHGETAAGRPAGNRSRLPIFEAGVEE